jgi:hypothetical protein
MNVLQRASSIRGVRELSNDDVRRLESEWNMVFTRLGVIQGQLKSRKRELLGQTALVYLCRAHIFRDGTPPLIDP